MDENKLIAALKAIGKECFVSYYELFNDESRRNDEVARIIHQERGYTLNSCNSRTSKASVSLLNISVTWAYICKI